MELWFSEHQTPDLSLGLRLRRTLHREHTRFQELLVVDSEAFGRVLCLDGTIQVTERDEFFYHEMLVHLPLMAHPDPRRVLVIGGGDGGSLREICRHEVVEAAVQVEIDPAVMAASRAYLPTLAVGFDDPRVDVRVADGIAFVREHREAFDVIICDSTDPVGPAQGLFEADFYRSCRTALRPGGILAVQSESPLVNADVVRRVALGMNAAFGQSHLALGPMPTYPSGLWSYTLATAAGDPRRPLPSRPLPERLRYYTRDIHAASFLLPPFVEEILAPATEP